jgi:hypothetical protein
LWYDSSTPCTTPCEVSASLPRRIPVQGGSRVARVGRRGQHKHDQAQFSKGRGQDALCGAAQKSVCESLGGLSSDIVTEVSVDSNISFQVKSSARSKEESSAELSGISWCCNASYGITILNVLGRRPYSFCSDFSADASG